MAELRCEGLAKSYGGHAVLRGVDLVVPQGTLTAILGSSGSGKTTLLRLVMGLARPDAGSVRVGGALMAKAGRIDVPPDKRAVGYVAQEGALFGHLTVGENVGFGLSRAERKRGRRVAQMLDLVGLGEAYRGRAVHELSGGEQRRVALARALAPRPRLVLLDEPFSGLDAALRADTRQAVLQALAGEGATAVLVTHDQAEALSMGDRVALLREGVLVQCDEPAALYRAPVDAHAARFLGEANLLPGVAAGGRVRCALGELEILARDVPGIEGGAPVQAMVRPEQIRLVGPNGVARGSDGKAVEARAVEHVYYGPHTIVWLALEGAPGQIVRARASSHEIPVPGEPVSLVVSGPVVVYPAQLPSVQATPKRDADRGRDALAAGQEAFSG